MRASDFRRIARESLKGNWFIAVLGGFIASLLGGLNNAGSFSFSFNYDGIEVPDVENGEGVASLISSPVNTGLYDGIIAFLMIMFSVVMIYSIIMFIIGSAVAVGYSEFNLDIVEGVKPGIGSIFSRFGQLKTAICARLIMFIRVFIGTMLFIIPGIIMSYSYAMVNFVMAEHPEMTARQALKESKRMMKGNRWRLFCLQLSFIGWVFVSVFTLGIGFLFLVPYQQAALAAFYCDVRDRANYPFSAVNI